VRKKDIERRARKARKIIKEACKMVRIKPPRVVFFVFCRGTPYWNFRRGTYYKELKEILINTSKPFYEQAALHEVAHHIHCRKFKPKACIDDKRWHPMKFLKILFWLACWYYKGKPERYPIKTEYPFLRRPWKKLLKNYKKGLDKPKKLWYNILHNMGERNNKIKKEE